MEIIIKVILGRIIREIIKIIGTLILEEMEGAEVTNNRIGGVTITTMATITIAIGIITITKIKVEEVTAITIIIGQVILEEIIIQGSIMLTTTINNKIYPHNNLPKIVKI